MVVCNHVHLLDCTFIDCAIPVKRMYYTTLESNLGIPIARHLIRWFGGVPIPTSMENLKTFMTEMDRALKCGHFVCMYPEGVLYPYFSDLRDFKDGAFKIAARSNVPVLPLVITFRKPRGIYRLYKKKPCVTLKILPPVFPAAPRGRKSALEMKDKCYSAMRQAISN